MLKVRIVCFAVFIRLKCLWDCEGIASVWNSQTQHLLFAIARNWFHSSYCGLCLPTQFQREAAISKSPLIAICQIWRKLQRFRSGVALLGGCHPLNPVNRNFSHDMNFFETFLHHLMYLRLYNFSYKVTEDTLTHTTNAT